MKSKMKHAVSLIVLVVTILVLSIIAAAVIISLSNANIMGQASKTVFKQDMANYKETYELYVTNKLADNPTYDRTTLDANYQNDANLFINIFGEVEEKYQKGLMIIKGRIVYDTEDEVEYNILVELNMDVREKSPETEETNYISKNESYVGWYVKIGDEYAVIFADLLYGGEGKWSETNDSTYKYDAVDKDKLKDYTISSTKHNDSSFGENYVLEVAGDTTGKQDRFYVMALSDINTETSYCWYDAAYDKGIDNSNSQVTSTDFGTGKANTATMITAWNATTYGAQNDRSGYLDMWGVIQTKVNNGWFVPSKDEWSAFAVYLKGRSPALDTSNYSTTYGLKSYYWSSSLCDTSASVRTAWYARFEGGYLRYYYMLHHYYVRLAATF